MEKRVISTQVQEEDLKIEKSLRPQTLDDYIGQQKAKENLSRRQRRGGNPSTMCCSTDRPDLERPRSPESLPMRWEHI